LSTRDRRNNWIMNVVKYITIDKSR